MAPGSYRIVVRGRLSEAVVDGLGSVARTSRDSDTVLEGPFVDQSHLHGLLDRLRDLGIEIVSFDTSPREAQP